MSKFSSRSAVIVSIVLVSGCGDGDARVDPEGRDPHVHASETDALRQVVLRDVVAASLGVPTAEAPAALERYLSGRSNELVAHWPRAGGGLDLDRAPIAATELSAWIGPGSKSRCGEVTVVFRGTSGPALRARLPVPGSTPQCRGIQRDNHVTGTDALVLLRAAIADARVPVGATLPMIAAN